MEIDKWSTLPIFLLEEIFSYLSISDRFHASLACSNWQSSFHSPNVWSQLIVDDRFLSELAFNYHTGWQFVLANGRLQNYFAKFGCHIRHVILRPIVGFTKLYQFLIAFTWFIENIQQHDAHDRKPKIKRLSFVFPCNIPIADDPNGIKLFGIGVSGQLIASLKKMCSHLLHLKYLKLTDLVLERFDANHLLDEISRVCNQGLTQLELINITTLHCPMTQIGMFENLQILIISPQNLDDKILLTITDSNLRHLRILQNDHTPESTIPCSASAWRQFECANRNGIRVHLYVESACAREILLQPDAPIHSIWYKTTKSKMRSDVLCDIISMYRKTLAIYGYENLPQFDIPRPRSQRMDRTLIKLLKECRETKTFVTREKISTSTVLLLATIGTRLRNLVVRKNAVLLKCDWTEEECKSNGWNYQWLRHNARSYDKTEAEVSKIFGSRWVMLSDRMYKQITLNQFSP